MRAADDRARVPDHRLVRRVARDEAALHAASIAARGSAPPDRVVAGRACCRRRLDCRCDPRRARRRRSPSRLGLRHQAGRRLRDADRRRGGGARPGRAGRARGLDRPAPARARVRPRVGLAGAAGEAGRAADLLEHGLPRPRRAPRRPHRDAVSRLPARGRARAARSRRHPRGRRGGRDRRHARRHARLRPGGARADADRAGDARRGDERPVPRPRRRPARLRPPDAERLGPRLRASRRQVAALDRLAQLAADATATSARSPGRPRSSGSIRSGGSSPLRSPTCSFGPWAASAWPTLSDALLEELEQ